MASITPLIGSAMAGALAWFTVNFLGKPILAIREKRLEALKTGERYSHVSSHSSDELRRLNHFTTLAMTFKPAVEKGRFLRVSGAGFSTTIWNSLHAACSD